jgi:hypothetical protein
MGLETIRKTNIGTVARVQKGLPLITEISLKNEERQRCEVWSRVMGYHRPVAGYNIGKKQEFQDRVNFKEPKEN